MPISSKVGHFNLLEEIGHGGMGSVYRAFDPSLNREVAIKVLRESLASDQKFLNEFLEEARAAAKVSHPHIVQVYFVGEDSGQYYIVMELVKGRTLREIIETDGPLGEERAVELTIDVTEGLRAAYKNQMIHGDIKPANIMVAEEVGAKILDFGLAKLANVEVAEKGEIWGSPYYISPERVGQKAEDFRSDVYSLGATLFHVLAGHPPFEADTPEELAGKRLNEKPPLLRDINPNLTLKTEQVVNKMLNKSIFLRYRDYDALLDDLKEAKTEATAKRLGVNLHPDQFQPPPPPPPPPPPEKSPLPLIVGGAVAVIVIAVLAFLLLHKKQPEQPHVTRPTQVERPKPPKPTPAPTPTPPPAQAMRNVEFTFTAPSASQVFLAGQFNNWDTSATPMRKRPNGEWVVSMQLKPGRYEYKFVVDGNWTTDPDNPDRAPNDMGNFNSVVTVGAPGAQAPKPSAPPPSPTLAPAAPTPAPPAPPAAASSTMKNVTFTLKMPTASTVTLGGEFNRWSKTANPMKKDASGEWSVTVPLKTGRHPYTFFVDGKPTLDPENPQKTNIGNYVDSVVDVGK